MFIFWYRLLVFSHITLDVDECYYFKDPISSTRPRVDYRFPTLLSKLFQTPLILTVDVEQSGLAFNQLEGLVAGSIVGLSAEHAAAAFVEPSSE